MRSIEKDMCCDFIVNTKKTKKKKNKKKIKKLGEEKQ